MEFPANPIPVDPGEPTSDEKTMAGLSHFFGWLVALIIYITQREKSKFVRFHALQAIIFDVAVTIATFLLVTVVLAVFFVGMAIMVAVVMAMAPSLENDPAGMSIFIVLASLAPMLPFFLLMPFVIVVLVLRIAAGRKALQGKHYRYPLIGKLAEGWAEA